MDQVPVASLAIEDGDAIANVALSKKRKPPQILLLLHLRFKLAAGSRAGLALHLLLPSIVMLVICVSQQVSIASTTTSYPTFSTPMPYIPKLVTPPGMETSRVFYSTSSTADDNTTLAYYLDPQVTNAGQGVSLVRLSGDLDTILYNAYGTDHSFLGGVSFEEPAADVLSARLYFNSTPASQITAEADTAIVEFYGRDAPSLLVLFSDAVWKWMEGSEHASFYTKLQTFPQSVEEVTYDLYEQYGELFCNLAMQSLTPFFVFTMVYERDQGLVEFLRGMGFRKRWQWISTLTVFLLEYLTAAFLLSAICVAFRMPMFYESSLVDIAALHLTWGVNLVLWCFLLSMAFRSRLWASAVSFFTVIPLVFGTVFLENSLPSEQQGIQQTDVLSAFLPHVGLSKMIHVLSFRANHPMVALAAKRTSTQNPFSAALAIAIGAATVQLFYISAVMNYRRLIAKGERSGWRRKLGERFKFFAVQTEATENQGDSEDAKKERERVNSVQPFAIRMVNTCFGIIIRDFCLGVGSGEIVAICGHKSSGKSLLAQLVAGMVPSDHSETILVLGHDAVKYRGTSGADLSFCPQSNTLFDEITGYEHLAFFAKQRGVANVQKEVTLMSERLQLKEAMQRRAKFFSLSEKRRMCLACALIGSPKVIILDEPTVNLTPKEQTRARKVIRYYASAHHSAVLMFTKDISDAEATSDRVLILAAGAVQTLGSTREITERMTGMCKLVMKTEPMFEDELHGFVMLLIPEAKLVFSYNGMREYMFPTSVTKMSTLFSEIEKRKVFYKISEWNVDGISLKEQFAVLCQPFET